MPALNALALFAWESLEDSPSLRALKALLASLPDAKLVEGLRQQRGRGRNDYPVHVLWGVVILRIALRHGDFEATLGELGRNAQLRRMIGIAEESQVPKAWNISRFLDVLGEEPHLSELRRVFDEMVHKLAAAVPDLGQQAAGDATSLKARGKRDPRAVADEDRVGLPQPSGGRKEYTDDEGKVTKIFEWFGYKLHRLVDVKHEVVLAYQVTSPKAGDGNIVGARRFHGFVGAVMIVHLAFATLLAGTPRREGTLGKLRLSAATAATRGRLATVLATSAANSLRPQRKKQRKPLKTKGLRSTPHRARTCNLRFRRPMLYPIELGVPGTVGGLTALTGALSTETQLRPRPKITTNRPAGKCFGDSPL